MQKHIENVQEFMKKAGQNVPESLTVPDEQTRLLRAKLVMEEALEMCAALGVGINPKYDGDYIESTSDLYFYIKDGVNLTEIADAAVDLLWVGVTGPMIDIGCVDKLQECIKAVDENNLEKFKSGHKCPETGKWIKNKNHPKVDLEKIIYEKKLS
jgi:predicted HAD superfamily Cof-like phosphohydrolase